jgi:tetratricopeptide (TPR) repeat protein
MKELRTQLEATRRELNEELNKRELEAVDRALSYSGNTVNFLWLIMTMAVTGFWLVGWRTMKDVRENLTNNFEAQIQKNVRVQQKRLEEFMQKFEQEQLSQSKEILETQELMQKKQEWAYYWSQFNREEDGVVRLELLEKIAWLNVEEDELIILIERALIYVSLGLWDKALETSDRWLELSSENTTLLYTKAESLVMLEESEEGLKVINNVLVVKPSMREEIMEDPTFENLRQDIEEIVAENSNII